MCLLLSSGSNHGYLSSLVRTLVSSVIVSVHVEILGISDGSICLSYANGCGLKVASVTLSCRYWSIGKCLELLAWTGLLDQVLKYPISLLNVNLTVESDELCISKQHLLFSNLIFVGR